MNFILKVILIGIAFLALSTCAQVASVNGTTVAGNNPPTASFGNQIVVTEADITDINGIYGVYGTNGDSSFIYTNTNGYYIYRFAYSSWCGTPHWRIDTNITNLGWYKYNGTSDLNVPATKWGMVCQASHSGTPMLWPNNAIKGVPFVGQTVIAPSYTYQDSEGDTEGSTVIAWYRCNDTNDFGSPISGENNTNYTLTSADNGKYIYYSVTPAATSGTTTGAPAKTRYFGPVQTMPTAFVVSGAGTSAYDGIYAFNGFFNGLPYFKHQTANYFLFYAGCSAGRWIIKDYLYSDEGSYGCDTTGNRTLDFTNYSWYQCGESGPAPTIIATNY